MTRRLFASLRSLLLPGLLLAVFAVGCSPQAKFDRHMANAQRYVEAGNFEAAEIEYLNAQRLVPNAPAVIAGLGSLFFDQGSLTKAAPLLVAARDLAPENLEARHRLARTLLTLGPPGEARTEALFLLERQPGDPEALQLLVESSSTPEQVADARARITGDDAAANIALALLALRENNVAEATTRTERALALDPRSATAFSLLGNIHLVRNEYEAAGAALKSAADLAPPRSARHIAYARFLLNRGELENGRKVLETVAEAAPDYIPAAIMLADIAATARDYEKALEILGTVLGRDPGHPEAAVMRARIRLTRGENTTAVTDLEKLTQTYPDGAALHYLLATAYVATNDTNRALASLSRTLQLAPDHADATLLRAALQLRTGDPGAAVPALRELVKSNPGLGRARVLLADALRARGQIDEAIEVYEEAISAAPEDPQLRFFAGALWLQIGRTAQARQAFTQALSLAPGFTPALERLVAIEIAGGDLPAADRLAREFVTAHPDRAEAHVLAAKVAVAQRDNPRAEAGLRRAMEVSPDSATAYLLLAQLYLQDKRQDEALANLHAAAQRNPRDITALMLIGILQQQKGDLPAARASYEQLLESSPRFVPALNNLAYLYSENFGELDKAYELANRARDLRPNDPIALDTFGWILFQKGEYAWASSVLSESASRLGDNPEVMYHLGMTRYMLGDEAGARSALTTAMRATADFPGKEIARAHLALLEIPAGQADDAALAMIRERLAASPNDPVALTRLAAVHMARGNPAEARAAYESALKAHPNNPTAVTQLAGFLATQSSELPRAFELAKAAYKLAPEDTTVLQTLGRIAFASGDRAWADSLLREAARRAPGSPEVQFDYAEATYAVGQVADALGAMRAALQASASFPRAVEAREFIELVDPLVTRQLPARAAELSQAVLSRSPESVPALMLAGAAHESAGAVASAIPLYEQVLRLRPTFTPAQKRLAVLHAGENPPSARAHDVATQARAALPNDPEVAGALGTILQRRGEHARAAALLAEAARSPAAAPEIHYLLGMAQRALGDAPRGSASLRRALELGLTGAQADEARKALE